MTNIQGFHKPKMPAKAPVLHSIKVQKTANGFTAQHSEGLGFTKTYVFPNSDKLAKHMTHTAHALWLGNKTSTPKLRGAKAAHREKQLETSSY